MVFVPMNVNDPVVPLMLYIEMSPDSRFAT